MRRLQSLSARYVGGCFGGSLKLMYILTSHTLLLPRASLTVPFTSRAGIGVVSPGVYTVLYMNIIPDTCIIYTFIVTYVGGSKAPRIL